MSNNQKNQDLMSTHDLKTYLDYAVSGQVESDKHAKELNRLARRTMTMSDTVVVVRALTQQQEQTITSLIDTLQVHKRVLEKLGATEEMFSEARQEYKELINEKTKELKEQMGIDEDSDSETESEDEEVKKE